MLLVGRSSNHLKCVSQPLVHQRTQLLFYCVPPQFFIGVFGGRIQDGILLAVYDNTPSVISGTLQAIHLVCVSGGN